MQFKAKFYIGQVVAHNKFGYRGVVVDVDADFQETEEWYTQKAKTRPPKDKPWYRILVDDQENETYVAEKNLCEDISGQPVEHPFLEHFFDKYEDNRYFSSNLFN